MCYKLNCSVGLTISRELSGYICGKSSFRLVLISVMILFSFDWSELYIGNIARIMKHEPWKLQCISTAAMYTLFLLIFAQWNLEYDLWIVFGVSLWLYATKLYMVWHVSVFEGGSYQVIDIQKAIKGILFEIYTKYKSV
jgi:hypothetical protein